MTWICNWKLRALSLALLWGVSVVFAATASAQDEEAAPTAMTTEAADERVAAARCAGARGAIQASSRDPGGTGRTGAAAVSNQPPQATTAISPANSKSADASTKRVRDIR